MKKLLPLFSCLLLIGCGEKSSPEGLESASESATPPSEDVKPSADSPEPLISDADVERFAKDAMDSLAGGVPSGRLHRVVENSRSRAISRTRSVEKRQTRWPCHALA